ncbi:MAG TPA: ABC transporter ATP-binding protein [Candidatus Acetothermia bacterium]|nr:ABC transporter ATP-binding protein [Candidatus Acetothermia bacterium]
MTEAIRLQGLTKAYGSLRALDRVDLEVPQGAVFGFLGPNGAGKTTTLRILAGLARPTSGRAEVLGHDVVSASNSVRQMMGFLPDVPGFYPWMTAREMLEFSGRLFGLSGKTLDDRVAALLDLAGLAGVKARLGGYSRGMRQRLGVAQALINAPRLLMLDEPTSALDPIGRKAVLDMVMSLAGRTTVFFSTHILSDVERVCESVAILHRGQVAAHARIAELKARYGVQKIAIDLVGSIEEAVTEFRRAPWATDVQLAPNQRIELTISDISAAERAIPSIAAACDVGIRRLEAVEVSLEDVFVDLVGGEGG